MRNLLLASLLCLAPLAAGALACGPDDLGRVRPDLLIEVDRLDFGRLPVLNVGEQVLVVKNRGQAGLEITSLEIGGDDAAFYWVEAQPAEAIPFGNEDEIVVRFRPEEERSYTATLTVATNDETEGTAVITLFGVGDTIAAIEVEPAAIHFGLVGEGLTAVEGFEIRSVGSAPLIVESVELVEGSSIAFIPVGSWGSGTLAAGASIPLSVGFSPSPERPGTTGTIRITSTDPLNRTVEVSLEGEVNHAPTPSCSGEELLGAPGDVITLDGSASSDPDGHEPVTYQWQVEQRPVNSNTDLSDTTGPTTSLELDVPGLWEVGLCVTDALGVPSLDCCRTKIRSVPAEKLYVELVWNHPQTDFDLHFLETGASVGSPGDCYWGNPNPDFGVAGDPADDPYLSRDDLAGFGPEIVTFPDPGPGTYAIVVDFVKDNGAANPSSDVTLRVYEYGIIAAEFTRTMVTDQVLWQVGEVAWPGGEVTAVDQLVAY
ncbi:MAG: choice-of-anchor D domain-containing protein [Deltaproteobacteria bacterium]|nr:choice-of-anchor D domain-containing protein [Deltaproteobacteria bacterium]